jgi:hypothetical protein
VSAGSLAGASSEFAAWPGFPGDLHLESGDVPHTLPGATADGVLWQAAPGRCLLRVPGAAAFLIEGGRRITVCAEPGSGPAAVQRFLRMTPLAALLYQRGVLAFHAAAAANSQGAILLAGDSGAGKSTLLMALLQRGWAMLGDELAAVELDEHRKAHVAPTFPEIRAWRNARQKLETDSEGPESGEDNWSTAMTSQFAAAPQPLRAIYWLAAHNADRTEQRELEGMERFRALGTLAYNSHIADAILDRAAYMRQAAVIAQTVPVHRWLRPRGKWTVEELAERIDGAPR